MRTRGTIILMSCLCVLLSAAGFRVAAEESETPRVGTFDTRGIALAYGRSDRPDCMRAKVAELRKELVRAVEDGDKKRAKELEAAGPALQEQIHRQVFSGAPIDEILALLADDLPAVADAAGVDLIVDKVLFARPGVEVVDITVDMAAAFGIDEKTRGMILEILVTEPVPESRLSHDH